MSRDKTKKREKGWKDIINKDFVVDSVKEKMVTKEARNNDYKVPGIFL